MLSLVVGMSSGCGKKPLSTGGAGGSIGGGIVGTGGIAQTGAGGVGSTGSGGMAAPCAGASDPRLVVAGQRVLRLTSDEIVKTVRYLVNDQEAQALVQSGMFSVTRADEKHFPPADGEEQTINQTSVLPLLNVAEHVAGYVLANFATVTGCASVTDACATTYLDKLAARAYRRPLTTEEQTRFRALFDKLRSSQIVNGYEVTFTVEEATSYAVSALLSSPQMLWRWEIGDPAMDTTAPAGIPLTEHELATQLAFFLTDQPPDDLLVAAAAAGTLRANLPAHASRILQTPSARDWMRSVMEIYFHLNQLPYAPVDNTKFPAFDNGLLFSMQTDAQRFLDTVLWSGSLGDLLLSRTAFVNTRLANDIYKIPVPAGATFDNFVQVSLPATQRSGILTNAAFLTARARADGLNLVVPRGLAVRSLFLCLPTPPPDFTNAAAEIEQAKNLYKQTGQEQVATREGVPSCKYCHTLFDGFGLALEKYDNLAVLRTSYDSLPGSPPIDTHATLPPELGSVTVNDAVEMANVLATSPAFTSCMASAMLQYSLVDSTATVEVPALPERAGCATTDVVARYESAGGKTFTDLIRATVTAPAFALRRAAP